MVRSLADRTFQLRRSYTLVTDLCSHGDLDALVYKSMSVLLLPSLSAVLLIPRVDLVPQYKHISLFQYSMCLLVFSKNVFKIEKKYVSVFIRVLECWVQTNSALIYAGAVKDLRSIS